MIQCGNAYDHASADGVCDDKIYLEPDISVICDKDKTKENGCRVAPDWVIEVTSESTI